MQKQFTTLCGALAVIGMLLVAASTVNHASKVPVWNNDSQLADSIPMPPPKPSNVGHNTNVVIADGIPMPPPKPREFHTSGSVLVADGIPMPPPKPTRLG